MEHAGPQTAIYSRHFAVPKPGNTAEQYEDACAEDPPAGRYAIADGASDSVFAGVWARLLVEHLLTGLPEPGGPAAWHAWLRPVQERWGATAHAASLPWYVAAKVREGAFATCLGLQLHPPPHRGAAGRWTAMAVGDCCLFHVQMAGSNGVVPDPSPAARGFPCATPEDFNQHPLALSSSPHRNEVVWPQVATTGGAWRPGDTFILATDALALWIIRAVAPEQAWHRLLSLSEAADDAGFQQLVAELRDGGAVRDDDLTLLLLHTGQPVDAHARDDVAPAATPHA